MVCLVKLPRQPNTGECAASERGGSTRGPSGVAHRAEHAARHLRSFRARNTRQQRVRPSASQAHKWLSVGLRPSSGVASRARCPVPRPSGASLRSFTLRPRALAGPSFRRARRCAPARVLTCRAAAPSPRSSLGAGHARALGGASSSGCPSSCSRAAHPPRSPPLPFARCARARVAPPRLASHTRAPTLRAGPRSPHRGVTAAPAPPRALRAAALALKNHLTTHPRFPGCLHFRSGVKALRFAPPARAALTRP